MKLGIIISQTDPETVWNAYRFGVYALEQGDSVKTFLLGQGVESEVEHPSREMESSDSCPLSTMKDLHDIVKDSDKVVTF